MISIKENVNSVEEFNYLYDAVGWESYDEKISEKALENTIYSVSVYEDNKIIGYGRLIGDEICFLYIHDAKYQNKKIGTQIMDKLLDKVNQIKLENPYVRVYLGASKGKEKFYERFGFITREDANLGSSMILDGFDK